MSIATQAPEYIRAMMAYLPGKPVSELAREMGIEPDGIVKLASNENPLGMSPRACEAAQQALAEGARYPDGNGFGLKAALCARYGVRQEQIVLGNGSNDILELAAHTFLRPGTSAIYSRYAFAVYPLATQAAGARGIEVPDRQFGHDLDAILASITTDTRVIFIANPNNPTGTFIPGAALEAFLLRVPDNVLVVLDEAYTEYISGAHYYDSIAWLERFPNLLISRTFSKAYGLAGLRVGYGFGHPFVIDLMNRVRQPFNVSSMALAAAEAALGDVGFLQRTAEINACGMAQITEALARLDLSWIESVANFVTFSVPNAAEVNQALLRKGVIVRPLAGYGMPEWLRVSIGLPKENVVFIEALQSVLKMQMHG